MKLYRILAVLLVILPLLACEQGSGPATPQKPFSDLNFKPGPGGSGPGLPGTVPDESLKPGSDAEKLAACAKNAAATGVITPECQAVLKPFMDLMVLNQKTPAQPVDSGVPASTPDATQPTQGAEPGTPAPGSIPDGPAVSTVSLPSECTTVADDVLMSIAKFNLPLATVLKSGLDYKLDAAGKLSPKAAFESTEHHFGSSSLETLKGINCFPETYLVEAVNNTITDLEPLKSLGMLTFVTLTNNKVTDLTPLIVLKDLQTFSKLNGLQTVEVQGNPLKDECQVFELAKRGVDTTYFPYVKEYDLYALKKKQCEGKCPAIALPAINVSLLTEEPNQPKATSTVSVPVVGGKALLKLQEYQKFKSASFKVTSGDAPISYAITKKPTAVAFSGAVFNGDVLSITSPTNLSGVFEVTVTDGCGQSIAVQFEVAEFFKVNLNTLNTVSISALNSVRFDYDASYVDDATQVAISLYDSQNNQLRSTSWNYITDGDQLGPGPNEPTYNKWALEYILPSQKKLSDIAKIRFDIKDPGFGPALDITIKRIYLKAEDGSNWVYDAYPNYHHKSSGSGTPFSFGIDPAGWKQVAPPAEKIEFK